MTMAKHPFEHMPNMPDDTGIEEFPGGGVVCTGVGVDIYRILVLRGAMEIELSGLSVLRGGRSAFAAIKREFGLKGSRASVYTQFCRMHSLPTRDERKAITRAVAQTKQSSTEE